jgi:hypothetical protein
MMAPLAGLFSLSLFVIVPDHYHIAAALADFEKACSPGSERGCRNLKTLSDKK